MVRSYGNIAVQIGVEASAGAAVPADKQLMGLTLDPHASFDTKQFKPSGYKVPTVSAVTTEKTEADWEGPIDYKNIVYPLSSLFGAGVVTQPDAATSPTVYQWDWTFLGKGAITPQTFSVEVGDSASATKFSYGTFTGMDLAIERTGDNKMSGAMLGQALTTGASLTASPTEVEIVPVNGDHWDVYADSASTGLGTTQLDACYSADLSFGDVFKEEFVINSAKSSFNALFDAEDPKYEWKMTLGADAVAEAYFETLRNGGKTFIQLKATGPKIDSTLAYGITIGMCVVVTDVDAYQSSDGMYVLPLSFALAYDATWGKAMTISVTNDLAAL